MIQQNLNNTAKAGSLDVLSMLNRQSLPSDTAGKLSVSTSFSDLMAQSVNVSSAELKQATTKGMSVDLSALTAADVAEMPEEMSHLLTQMKALSSEADVSQLESVSDWLQSMGVQLENASTEGEMISPEALLASLESEPALSQLATELKGVMAKMGEEASFDNVPENIAAPVSPGEESVPTVDEISSLPQITIDVSGRSILSGQNAAVRHELPEVAIDTSSEISLDASEGILPTVENKKSDALNRTVVSTEEMDAVVKQAMPLSAEHTHFQQGTDLKEGIDLKQDTGLTQDAELNIQSQNRQVNKERSDATATVNAMAQGKDVASDGLVEGADTHLTEDAPLVEQAVANHTHDDVAVLSDDVEGVADETVSLNRSDLISEEDKFVMDVEGAVEETVSLNRTDLAKEEDEFVMDVEGAADETVSLNRSDLNPNEDKTVMDAKEVASDEQKVERQVESHEKMIAPSDAQKAETSVAEGRVDQTAPQASASVSREGTSGNSATQSHSSSSSNLQQSASQGAGQQNQQGAGQQSNSGQQQAQVEQMQRQQSFQNTMQDQQLREKSFTDLLTAEKLKAEKTVEAEKMSADLNLSSDRKTQLPLGLQSIQQPIRHPQWGSALGQRVVYMANSQIQEAKITLNPEKLGPVQVKLQLDKEQQVHVSMTAQHSVTREAMENALPRLKEMLESAGIQYASVDVSEERSFDQAQQDGEQGEQAKGGSRYAQGMDDVSTEETVVQSVSDNLVDYYA